MQYRSLAEASWRGAVVACVTWILTWTALTPAHAAKRVALVIGNGAYVNAPVLVNPVNDARDIAASFERLGFSVTKLSDADFDAMRRGMNAFGHEAEDSDIAVIYFAGHGMEIGGENWLIPVDAELRSDTDVEGEAIGLKAAMLQVAKASRLGLVILDACRSNPFAKMQRPTRTRAVDRGFVRVEPTDNVLVAYAARDGTTANDGNGRNSPYTGALLKNLETPGLEIRFLFASVRDDVMAATDRNQQPFDYGSLSREPVYLKPPQQETQPITDTSKPGVSTSSDGSLYPPGSPNRKLTSAEPSNIVVPSVAAPAQITPPSSRTQSDFIFPDSDRRLLTPQDLSRLSKDDLRIARNEIVAREGRYFKSPDLVARFSQFSWYAPKTWDPHLNSIEEANIAAIERAESGTPVSDFVISDSDRRMLSVTDLNKLSKDELRIARNEIFARRGRYFDSADLKARFERFSWYHPNTWNPRLSPIEEANVALMDRVGKQP